MDEAVLIATLDHVRDCPARSDYIELSFATPEGSLKWCFPRPAVQEARRGGGPLVLKTGRYGLRAHLVDENGTGYALESASALPLIFGGCEVFIERSLVSANEVGVGHSSR